MKWLAVMLNCMLLSPLLVVPALAYHFNNPGYSLVHELLIRMRERGINMWGDVYPYAAASTALNAVFRT